LPCRAAGALLDLQGPGRREHTPWRGGAGQQAGEAVAVNLEWTSSLRVGVDEIDDQHQEIFRRSARLINALKAGNRAEVEPLIRFLTDYAMSHFECEERWMTEAEYPGLTAHRDAHQRFKDELREMTREYQRKGPTPLMALTVHNWLAHWLRLHIGGADVELGRWLAAREIHTEH
jgi:hemerythrin